MKILIFVLSISFTLQVFAEFESEKTVVVEGNFENADAAKPYLLNEAVMEAIKQYSGEVGLNYEQFSQKLNERFNTWFENYKTKSLSEKFGKNYATELSPEQKKTFLEGLEGRKKSEFLNFLRPGQLIDSYAFKSVEKNEAPPVTWKGTVVLKLNRAKLERLNSRLFSEQSKLYSKLFIVNEINLLNMAWSDLGLEKESLFTDPIMSSWNKWMTMNLPANVEEVINCTGPCLDQFGKWQQLTQGEGMQIPEDVANSLWVKVTFNLRKLLFVKDINEWHFEWDGSVLVLDSNTKKIISSFNLHTERKTWRGLDQKTLNSKLASFMYQSPLDAFNKVVRKVQDTPRLSRVNRLVVSGHRNLEDVLSLINQLKLQGSKLNFEVQMDVFSQKEAELLCFYQGEEKSFTDLLSQVKELKSSHSYRIVNEFTGIHHVLKLVAE